MGASACTPSDACARIRRQVGDEYAEEEQAKKNTRECEPIESLRFRCLIHTVEYLYTKPQPLIISFKKLVGWGSRVDHFDFSYT